MRVTQRHVIILKTLLHLIQAYFLVQLVTLTLGGGFGADPVEGLTKYTGIAALNSLVVSLVIGPATRFYRMGLMIRLRRPAGIYSFVWASLHLAVYAFLDLGLNVSLLISEIVERPYLTVGFVVWLVLLALTVTSTQAIQRKLGRRWQTLHNWVYLAAALAPIHFYWSSKSELIEPGIYLVISAALLLLRRRNVKMWIQSVLSPLQRLIYHTRAKAE
ncbi:protein-methionine-sulfoxide reductase heme-binding subunit MsrQ [Veronia pacifica]|uniref:Protein-methionine-sulfoxide reductase heme-binding subunit MsrQ n=1 Tax=Veronia pacifica TaxID=1080227 RepID=A0A1C3EKL0_9GAMM|nr:protein-methionine-sulfoxide reductase heme-binding subunit MsrQ [Veronia pacifica]ODA33778.1 sulfoxide reductase heme-binding subunit YedZ [Veronia pacifica]